MPHSESEILSEKPWFFIRVYNWLTTNINETVSWLFPEAKVIPENEAGNLMRRALNQKSLIDTISSGWVDLYVWHKAFIITAITLTIGLIGILAGAPIFCALTALFVCISAHALFAAHEEHRWKAAQLMTEETIALNKDLEANKEFFEKGVECVDGAATQLGKHAESMKKQAEAIEETAEVVQKQTEELTEIVVQVKEVTEDLVAYDKKLGDVLDVTTAELTKANEVLDGATQSIASISETAQQFGDAVQGFSSSQKEHSMLVKNFGLFVESRMQKEKQDLELEQKKRQEQQQEHLCSPEPELSAEEEDKATDALLEELHRSEALFEEMMASMPEEGQKFSMS